MQTIDDNSMFSRSGESCADGKLTVHIPVVVSKLMEEDIIGCAFACGKSKSEYIREVLREHLYGKKACVQFKVGGLTPGGDGRNLS